MDLRADLHLHTTASDGRWTPEELIEEVGQAGIDLFAITDHDSIGSLAEASEQVKGSGLRFLPGVELSAQLDGQRYHLLAYGFDATDSGLVELVEANGIRLAGASDGAVRMLFDAGYSISLDDYASYTWDRRRGGWKALNFLVDRGYCHDVRSYFDELFVDIPHPEPEFPAPEEIVRVARTAGGVVALAHPGLYFENGLDLQRLDQLVEMGIEGVECFSSYHDAATTQELRDYSRRRRLLITGGSDCHGGFVGRALGLPMVHVRDLDLGMLEERVIT
jgi:predicted metal-dependent phosphoesterase TrpH